MQVILNGVSAELANGLTVADVVPMVTDRTSGIAVARNGEVVPRSRWSGDVVAPGDRVDVLTAVQGG